MVTEESIEMKKKGEVRGSIFTLGLTYWMGDFTNLQCFHPFKTTGIQKGVGISACRTSLLLKNSATV